MRDRWTWILLALFLAALSGFWWARRAGLQSASDQSPRESLVLPNLGVAGLEKVRRLEILQPPQRLVFVRRGAESWRMIEPVTTLADREQVESLLVSLAELRPVPQAGPIAGALGSFGLEHPQAVIKLYADGNGDGRPIAALDIGRAFHQFRYVRSVGREEIQAVEARTLAQLDAPASAWRQRRVFDLATANIELLRIEAAGRVLEAVRAPGREKAGWKWVRPIEAAADDDRLEDLLASLVALGLDEQSESLIQNDTGDRSNQGLDPPSVVITLKYRSRRGELLEQGLAIGRPLANHPELVHARRTGEDQIVALPLSEFLGLIVDPNQRTTTRPTLPRPLPGAAGEHPSELPENVFAP